MRDWFGRACWSLYIHGVGPVWFQLWCMRRADKMIKRWIAKGITAPDDLPYENPDTF